jgi:hypothetical protein
VESLSNDCRISQYADLAFAAKKMSTDAWFWLTPIERARTGYLVFMPKQPVVWMDEQFKKSFRIPMRVSRAVYEKKSVLIATLDQVDNVLRLEDVWMYEGKLLRGSPFTQRWNTLLDFYGLHYKPDLMLQGGIHIQTATYESLASFPLPGTTCPTMMFAQGDKYPRRLRVQFAKGSAPAQPQIHQQRHAKVQGQGQAYAFVDSASEDEKEPVSHAPLPGELVAKAVPHESYPDTYTLWIDGKEKGFAAVQDLELSRRMRSFAATAGKKMEVKVEWNEEFNMYEILSLLHSE